MQSEFTTLQGAIHDFTNLKQEFEQIKIFKINEHMSTELLKINAKRIIFWSKWRTLNGICQKLKFEL